MAVNVGLPKDVPWRGQLVHTGIWKEPVTGPRMVRRLNIDGDGQGDLAGHGGEQRAVLVYQLDSYRYWAAELGRTDLVHGQFGENFTVDGLTDDEVCIGDRFRIGEAVFEVTQPRVTCYRVGIRLGEPRMAALLVSHGRPGFYLRVLTEGVVEAGDEIVKVASGPEAMTVAEVDALLYGPTHDRDAIARALRVPALSPGWQSSFRTLLESAESGSATSGNPGLTPAATSPPPAWAGFRPLTVTGIDTESRTVSSFRLAAPDGEPLPAALPGQFLTIRLRRTPDGSPLIRTYSLSGSPGAAEYRISVKREPHGAGSNYLHDEVRVGQTIECAAPRGTFTLRRGENPVVLVSAGVGATPVLAMLHALAEEPARERCGGCRAPATGPSIPSPTRAAACSPHSPERTPSSATANPAPTIDPARTSRSGGTCRATRSDDWGSRRTPRPTSADRSASWTTSRPSWPPSGSIRPASTPSGSPRAPRSLPAS